MQHTQTYTYARTDLVKRSRQYDFRPSVPTNLLKKQAIAHQSLLHPLLFLLSSLHSPYADAYQSGANGTAKDGLVDWLEAKRGVHEEGRLVFNVANL